jgi:hypothetical protein
MKTEFYAGLGMYHKCVKTLEGVVLPFMPQGETVEIDEEIYRVRSYALIIKGDEVIAHIRLD